MQHDLQHHIVPTVEVGYKKGDILQHFKNSNTCNTGFEPSMIIADHHNDFIDADWQSVRLIITDAAKGVNDAKIGDSYFNINSNAIWTIKDKYDMRLLLGRDMNHLQKVVSVYPAYSTIPVPSPDFMADFASCNGKGKIRVEMVNKSIPAVKMIDTMDINTHSLTYATLPSGHLALSIEAEVDNETETISAALDSNPLAFHSPTRRRQAPYEINKLQEKIKELELIIYGLEEGSEQWKAMYENLLASSTPAPSPTLPTILQECISALNASTGNSKLVDKIREYVAKPVDTSVDGKAKEYAAGMMGEPYEHWTHHADKTLFNTIEKAYRAGMSNSTAVDFLIKANKMKEALIEQIQRRDYKSALEIIDIIYNQTP